MEKITSMKYSSSLTELKEVNSSFDSGILRICYTGRNRNNSALSREVIEKCLPTIYNCPIVCNYDRDSGEFGGHDIEVFRDNDGSIRVVNLTQPVGIIPESSKVWFEEEEDPNGIIHEYLFAEALIWKRQEAYEKIRKDGITEHSMEISIRSGHQNEDFYEIDDFEFNAFTLIGVEPCFEGSSLEMFSREDTEKKYREMLCDLKAMFSTVTPSINEDDDKTKEISTEGGETTLENAKETIEEIKTAPEEAVATEATTDTGEAFALMSNITEELARGLEKAEVVRKEWGEYPRYRFENLDTEKKLVYAWDTAEWLLYGFTYEVAGDSVRIDFESKKRMKFEIVEFDEGEGSSAIMEAFALLENKLCDFKDTERNYQAATESISALTKERDELLSFKAEIENAEAKKARENILSGFEDLCGMEAFEALRSECMEYTESELEEKCYALRGRNSSVAKFSAETKVPKLKIEHKPIEGTTEPYGGIFVKYGIKSN